MISTPPDQHAAVRAGRGRARPALLHRGQRRHRRHGGGDRGGARARTSSPRPRARCASTRPCAKLRELIAGGAIGKPLTFTHHVGQWLPDWHPWEDYRTFYVAKRETGAAREIVPFELNWLTQLFGPVTELNAFVSKLSSLEADIDDIYSTLLGFESGVQGSMVDRGHLAGPRSGSRASSARRARCSGTGTARRVLQHSAGQSEEWIEHPDPPPVRGPGGEWVAENMYIEEMAGFVGAIAGRRAVAAVARGRPPAAADARGA